MSNNDQPSSQPEEQPTAPEDTTSLQQDGWPTSSEVGNTISSQSAPKPSHGKPILWWLGFLVLAGVYIYASRSKEPAGPSAIEWLHDLSVGQARAAKNNQLILVDFYATWCGACQTMDRDVFTRKDVAEALADWVPIKIDVDKQNALAARYEIQSLPTVLALTPQGQPITGFSGAASATEFIKWLKSAEKKRADAGKETN